MILSFSVFFRGNIGRPDGTLSQSHQYKTHQDDWPLPCQEFGYHGSLGPTTVHSILLANNQRCVQVPSTDCQPDVDLQPGMKERNLWKQFNILNFEI